MTEKQWYVFYVKSRRGLHRYLLEHDFVGEFASLKEYGRWLGAMRRYFIERTGIASPHIVSIEPSEVEGVYQYEEIAHA